jgi:hypothetical protein
MDTAVGTRTLTSLLCLLVFTAACGALFYHLILTAPVFLDESDCLERLKQSPLEFNTTWDYYYAIDHPALSHWCDRAVLQVLGITIGDLPKVDKNKDYDWNIAHGRTVPRAPVNALRTVNVVLLVGTMLSLFAAARLVFGKCLWGFVLTAPLVLSPAIITSVGAYIKTDAYLAFFFALAFALWLRFHLSKKPMRLAHMAIMGILAGLAVSTKLNGGLLVLAYLTYLAWHSTGFDRIWRPCVFGLLVFLIFVVVNPVMQRGGLVWPFEVMRDMLRLRGRISEFHDAYLGTARWDYMVNFLFPYWYLLPLFAILVYNARRESWFPPAILWSSFLVVGTAATVRQPFNRYLMPLNLGLFTIVLMSTISVAKRLHRGEIRLRDLVTAPAKPAASPGGAGGPPPG